MSPGDVTALGRGGDPLWFKDAIFYELHVRAFHDSNADGVGDFRGLAGKLDYLQDLGITTVWLLPFYPSPLRDDGYDIADYTSVHPIYGTLGDFRNFLREAHRRGLRVVTELVLNHSSDQHPWFQRARQAKPGSRWRDFYVWSDTHERYRDTRIIFKDFEPSNWTWDPVAKAYYWHRFYSHQPDLNFDNPEVRKAMFQVVDFWLGMGIDGLRLDAVPYLYQREGTNCENLPETHQFLKELRRHVDRKYPNRMLLAEANQWPEDAVPYFGDGDECHMAFHFPLMPRLFMGIRKEDRFPIIDILNQTPAIPDNCQWALFLRNHDELTLEMVTDEDRDYMYKVYATDPQARINLGIRRRLAPLLQNRRKVELMNGLLFSLPGTPVIYYADEIGMGDNIYLGDRNGVRTPMQWSSDRNAGFSMANPQRLYLPIIVDPEYHYEAVNVDAQQNNPHSLLWWMKRLIALRKRFKAFGRGSMEVLYPRNHKVLAFLRRYEDECILVVANLSRFVQGADLDLSAFKGMVPVEVFGRTAFPPIGDHSWFVTLGPHNFYWFSLEPAREGASGPGADLHALPSLTVPGSWESALTGKPKAFLEAALPAYLSRCRWFGGKARVVVGCHIQEAFPLLRGQGAPHLTLVQVEYSEGDPETYQVPVAFARREPETEAEDFPHPLLARLQVRPPGSDEGRVEHGVLYDALGDPVVAKALLDLIGRRRRLRAGSGEVHGVPSRFLQKLEGGTADLQPSLLGAEQSNTSVAFGRRLLLKFFRKLDEGLNPDLEISRFLSEKAAFDGTPPLAGAIEYRRHRREPLTLGVLHGFVENQGDAWRSTLDALGRCYERLLAQAPEWRTDPVPLGQETLLDLAAGEVPQKAYDVVGGYLEDAALLGRRTASLHLALAAPRNDPDFAPEPFTPHYQRSLYQSARTLSNAVFRLLEGAVEDLPEPLREKAREALGFEGRLLRRFRAVVDHRIHALRIRCHGDFHLGQVLFTGKNYFIIDFEGEPARSITERRLKRSPLRDVAGMLRSFDYAAFAALHHGSVRQEDVPVLEPWARFWVQSVSAVYLKAYVEETQGGRLLPRSRQDQEILLDFFLLEKAVYELRYELNNRPDWILLPLEGLGRLLETTS